MRPKAIGENSINCEVLGIPSHYRKVTIESGKVRTSYGTSLVQNLPPSWKIALDVARECLFSWLECDQKKAW